MTPRFPSANFKPSIRCKGTLKAGTTFQIGDVLYEIHAIAGNARAAARILCSSGGGNLDLLFCQPLIDAEKISHNALPFSQIASDVYATGQPTTVAVVAAVESLIQATCYGESWVCVKFTANVAGTIGFCDLARL